MTKSAQDLIKLLSTGLFGMKLYGSTSQSLQLVLRLFYGSATVRGCTCWPCDRFALNSM